MRISQFCFTSLERFFVVVVIVLILNKNNGLTFVGWL